MPRSVVDEEEAVECNHILLYLYQLPSTTSILYYPIDVSPTIDTIVIVDTYLEHNDTTYYKALFAMVKTYLCEILHYNIDEIEKTDSIWKFELKSVSGFQVKTIHYHLKQDPLSIIQLYKLTHVYIDKVNTTTMTQSILDQVPDLILLQPST
jgi:hypothetical protein